MAAFNDFQVDPCVGAQLKLCLLLKACLLEKAKPINRRKQRQIGPSGEQAAVNVSIRAKLNEVYTCLLEELQRAYDNAGLSAEFPAIPPFPNQIDFGVSASVAAPLDIRINSDPLEFLSSVMTVEFDENGNPTWIRCP